MAFWITMKKRTFVIYTTYTWFRVLYGLIFYPYKTIRDIVRHPILVPALMTPFLGLFVLFVLGRIGAILVDVYDVNRAFIAIVLGSSLFAIALWQLLLIYLLFSLISAKRSE